MLRAFKTRRSREIQRSLEITLDAERIGIRFYCISVDCTRYSVAVQIWVRFLVIFISLVFPFFFPVIRKSAGLCLRSYIYPYVLSWKIFKVKFMGTVVYSDDIFYPVLMVCALFFMLFPFVRSLHQALFNVYYRFVFNQT